MKQPQGLVNGHPPAAFLGLPIPLVSRIHVFLGEVAAQKVKVGRVHSDQPGIQHVLYLQREEADQMTMLSTQIETTEMKETNMRLVFSNIHLLALIREVISIHEAAPFRSMAM